MKKENWEKEFEKRFRGYAKNLEGNWTFKFGLEYEIKSFISQKFQEYAQQERERITDMLFKCYPSDMENFSTMTEDQAYRLLKCFWKKLNQ